MQIGLITGGGTGPELSEVFVHAAEAFASTAGDPVTIVRCPHVFRSFTELHGLDLEACSQIVARDLAELAAFDRSFYRAGGRLAFRTAINAETLYALRRDLEGLKISQAIVGNRRVAFVRDQAQGFYACEGWRGAPVTIEFHGSFSKDKLRRIYRYAMAHTAEWLGAGAEVWFVYKHHLFANSLADWAAEICPAGTILQPGMAFAKLSAARQADHDRGILLIAGNEIGDLLQEVFIDQTGFHRETCCARNVYLHADVEGLVEYQTVHGSADDIAGQQRVNPVAALRAAAALFDEARVTSRHSVAMEKAIEAGYETGLLHSLTRISKPTSQTARQLVEIAVQGLSAPVAAASR